MAPISHRLLSRLSPDARMLVGLELEARLELLKHALVRMGASEPEVRGNMAVAARDMLVAGFGFVIESAATLAPDVGKPAEAPPPIVEPALTPAAKYAQASAAVESSAPQPSVKQLNYFKLLRDQWERKNKGTVWSTLHAFPATAEACSYQIDLLKRGLDAAPTGAR